MNRAGKLGPQDSSGGNFENIIHKINIYIVKTISYGIFTISEARKSTFGSWGKEEEGGRFQKMTCQHLAHGVKRREQEEGSLLPANTIIASCSLNRYHRRSIIWVFHLVLTTV